MKSTILSFILAVTFSGLIKSQNISGWRPENRTGVSAETGLMKTFGFDQVTKYQWLAPGKPYWSIGRNWPDEDMA